MNYNYCLFNICPFTKAEGGNSCHDDGFNNVELLVRRCGLLLWTLLLAETDMDVSEACSIVGGKGGATSV